MKKTIMFTFFITFFVSIFFGINLKFYCLTWQPQAANKVWDIVDEWNFTHPDIQVEIIWGTWESSDQYLLTSFDGGEGPDIFHTDAEKFREYGVMGYAEPLDRFITEDMINDIPANVWENSKDFQGNTYGVPWCQESQVIFFNKTLFEEHNIELPEDRIVTWEKLLEIANEITDIEGDKKTWGLLAPLMERFEWTLIKQNNGKVLHQDERGRWEVKVTDEAKEAISFYISLITKHKVMPADVISIDYTSLMQGFLNEKYAMVTFGCWNRRFLNQMGSDFEWGMMWIKKNGNKTNASDPQALGISVFSNHKEEAFEFIKYFTNKENSADISYADWLFPVRESALEDPRFSAEENEWNYAYEWLKNAKNVKPGMPGFYTFEWKVFVPMLEKVILGDLTLDKAYEKIEADGNVLLKKLGLR